MQMIDNLHLWKLTTCISLENVLAKVIKLFVKQQKLKS
jgi:hypothetical protein